MITWTFKGRTSKQRSVVCQASQNTDTCEIKTEKPTMYMHGTPEGEHIIHRSFGCHVAAVLHTGLKMIMTNV